MKKPTTTTKTQDVWNEDSGAEIELTPDLEQDLGVLLTAEQQTKQQVQVKESHYDMEGLMTDFPTATELMRFVFDETGIALNLKGRNNKIKYQVAMDCLNGGEVAAEFVSRENPYLDKNDMVPEEALRELPEPSPLIPDHTQTQNVFHSRFVPHPDPERRAADKKVDVEFRKYMNGMITYKILGPISPRPEGQKIDKYGRVRPEIIRWVDPRTEERILRNHDGTLTRTGQRLQALMQSQKVNKSTVWATWIDRDFVSVQEEIIENPWNDND